MNIPRDPSEFLSWLISFSDYLKVTIWYDLSYALKVLGTRTSGVRPEYKTALSHDEQLCDNSSQQKWFIYNKRKRKREINSLL
jgi:hypothetical protein